MEPLSSLGGRGVAGGAVAVETVEDFTLPFNFTTFGSTLGAVFGGGAEEEALTVEAAQEFEEFKLEVILQSFELVLSFTAFIELLPFSSSEESVLLEDTGRRSAVDGCLEVSLSTLTEDFPTEDTDLVISSLPFIWEEGVPFTVLLAVLTTLRGIFIELFSFLYLFPPPPPALDLLFFEEDFLEDLFLLAFVLDFLTLRCSFLPPTVVFFDIYPFINTKKQINEKIVYNKKSTVTIRNNPVL